MLKLYDYTEIKSVYYDLIEKWYCYNTELNYDIIEIKDLNVQSDFTREIKNQLLILINNIKVNFDYNEKYYNENQNYKALKYINKIKKLLIF